MNTNITALHFTLVEKFLLANGWVALKKNESGSRYYGLKEDNSIKFRLSNHFFACWDTATFQLILTDFQPNVYTFIVNGQNITLFSLKETKELIKSITFLYHAGTAYFHSKKITPHEPEANDWKKLYDDKVKVVEKQKEKTVTLNTKVFALQKENSKLKKEIKKLNKIIASTTTGTLSEEDADKIINTDNHKNPNYVKALEAKIIGLKKQNATVTDAITRRNTEIHELKQQIKQYKNVTYEVELIAA